MHKTLAALFLVLTAAVGTFAVPATARAAQTSDAKVVIIVGATHGATSDYRSKADQAYAEAKKHTPNVYKVYSPNATWSKVKSATVNASVVIYFGHGNGWPSPYPKDSAYTTKDGFGLNATAGNGDGNTKYYGEPYVSTLDLAPNAVDPAPSPLLRVGQLGAREPGAHPLGRQAARRQLRGGLPAGPAPVPSSPTATAERSTTCAPCSPPTSAWSTCGGPSRTTTATSSPSRPPERRARPRSWIRTPRHRATTAPWSATRT